MVENHHRFRRSIFIPVILIVVGVVLLLYNFGVVSSDAWEIIFRLWPVVLIALGLDSVMKREGLVGPIFVIGIGAAFLSSTLGLLDISVWALVLTLWPLILIAIGLDIALGRRSVAWSLIAVVIFLLLLIGSVWLLSSPVVGSTTAEEISQPIDGASQAQIYIKPSVGTLVLKSHQYEDLLIEGEIRLARRENVSSEFSVINGTANYSLKSTGLVIFAIPGENRSWTWDLALSQEIPLELKIELGAGISRIDLTDLTVNQLDLNVSVGETRLTMPTQGYLEARVENTIGSTTIVLPPTMAMRLTADTGLVSVQVPVDFVIQDDVYTSPDYATAEDRIELSVNQAIGVVRVVYQD